ncbi:MAG: hypothetical protein LBL75_00870 [Rickettsiales bacterium]|jgi:hypothetical protein|nr:hypothetical protein [Rickettsiales bacterium]
MKIKRRFFSRTQRGGMMIEILLSLAITAAALPFVLRDVANRARRAENVMVAREIADVRDALERYMDTNKYELLKPISRTITRVKMADLATYGNLPTDMDKYAARVIKSRDVNGRGVLSGVVIYNSENESVMRTREIAAFGGGSAGFIEDGRAIGVYGDWTSNTSIFDANIEKDAIVQNTGTIISSGDFLWRIPSDNATDGTMSSDLSLGGYGILDARDITTYTSDWTEIFKADAINARTARITPRADIDFGVIVSGDAGVMGALTSDSRNAELTGGLFINGDARLSRLEASQLWVRDLSLSALSSSNEDGTAAMNIGGVMDITRGHIYSQVATIGSQGSIAPKIAIETKISDNTNPNYYWDLELGDAAMSDIILGQLTPMIQNAIKKESGNSRTLSAFSQISANNNATLLDYVRATEDIKKQLQQKYIQIQEIIKNTQN